MRIRGVVSLEAMIFSWGKFVECMMPEFGLWRSFKRGHILARDFQVP